MAPTDILFLFARGVTKPEGRREREGEKGGTERPVISGYGQANPTLWRKGQDIMIEVDYCVI